jgi:MFS family permease
VKQAFHQRSEIVSDRIIDGTDASNHMSSAPVLAPKTSVAPVKRRWLSNFILTFAMFADLNESGIVSTLFVLISKDLGFGLAILGTLTALGKIIAAIFGPLWTVLARRYNRKAILVGTSIVFGLWTVAMGFSQNFTQYLILFIIATIGTVGAEPIVTELLGDLFVDKERGRAIGFVYGTLGLAGAITTPLLGQLSHIPHGWRFGYYIVGAVMGLTGLLILVCVHDPGRGASEPQSAGSQKRSSNASALKWSEVKQLFKIPSYILMLVSRILSGHLLIQSFGVVYLITVLHYSTAQAALVVGVGSLGAVVGNYVGGAVVDQISKVSQRRGRVVLLQLAQVLFALVAGGFLLLNGGNTWLMIVFFFGMFFLQGVNPGINRPIVYSVVPPALRGAAFAVMLSIVQSAGWAVYNLFAGFLGQQFGLRPVFFWILVVIMLINALAIFGLYWTYWPDVQKLQISPQEQGSIEGA